MTAYLLPASVATDATYVLVRPAPLGYRIIGSPAYGSNPNALRLDISLSIQLKRTFTSADLNRLVSRISVGTNTLIVTAERLGFEPPTNAADGNLAADVARGAVSCSVTGNIPVARVGKWISIQNEIKQVDSVTPGANTTITFQPMLWTPASSGSVIRMAAPRGSYVPRADVTFQETGKNDAGRMIGSMSLDLVQAGFT